MQGKTGASLFWERDHVEKNNQKKVLSHVHRSHYVHRENRQSCLVLLHALEIKYNLCFFVFQHHLQILLAKHFLCKLTRRNLANQSTP